MFVTNVYKEWLLLMPESDGDPVADLRSELDTHCDLETVTSAELWPSIKTLITNASVYSASFFCSHVQQNQLR